MQSSSLAPPQEDAIAALLATPAALGPLPGSPAVDPRLSPVLPPPLAGASPPDAPVVPCEARGSVTSLLTHTPIHTGADSDAGASADAGAAEPIARPVTPSLAASISASVPMGPPVPPPATATPLPAASSSSSSSSSSSNDDDDDDDDEGSASDTDTDSDDGSGGAEPLLRALAPLYSSQTFLGLVASRSQPRESTQALVNLSMAAGVRFVYFSREDERNTHTFGAKIDLFTGFNHFISLRDPADCTESELFVSKSRLPRGVAAVRRHLATVDNVPLLVSLFCDATAPRVRGMLGLYRTSRSVVAALGSSLHLRNAAVLGECDVAAVLDPERPQLCYHSRFAGVAQPTHVACLLAEDPNVDPDLDPVARADTDEEADAALDADAVVEPEAGGSCARAPAGPAAPNPAVAAAAAAVAAALAAGGTETAETGPLLVFGPEMPLSVAATGVVLTPAMRTVHFDWISAGSGTGTGTDIGADSGADAAAAAAASASGGARRQGRFRGRGSGRALLACCWRPRSSSGARGGGGDSCDDAALYAPFGYRDRDCDSGDDGDDDDNDGDDDDCDDRSGGSSSGGGGSGPSVPPLIVSAPSLSSVPALLPWVGFDLNLTRALTSLPAAVRLPEGASPAALAALMTAARLLVEAQRQAVFFVTCSCIGLTAVQTLSLAAGLPAVLTPGGLTFLLSVVVPALTVTVLAADPAATAPPSVAAAAAEAVAAATRGHHHDSSESSSESSSDDTGSGTENGTKGRHKHRRRRGRGHDHDHGRRRRHRRRGSNSGSDSGSSCTSDSERESRSAKRARKAKVSSAAAGSATGSVADWAADSVAGAAGAAAAAAGNCGRAGRSEGGGSRSRSRSKSRSRSRSRSRSQPHSRSRSRSRSRSHSRSSRSRSRSHSGSHSRSRSRSRSHSASVSTISSSSSTSLDSAARAATRARSRARARARRASARVARAAARQRRAWARRASGFNRTGRYSVRGLLEAPPVKNSLADEDTYAPRALARHLAVLTVPAALVALVAWVVLLFAVSNSDALFVAPPFAADAAATLLARRPAGLVVPALEPVGEHVAPTVAAAAAPAHTTAGVDLSASGVSVSVGPRASATAGDWLLWRVTETSSEFLREHYAYGRGTPAAILEPALELWRQGGQAGASAAEARWRCVGRRHRTPAAPGAGGPETAATVCTTADDYRESALVAAVAAGPEADAVFSRGLTIIQWIMTVLLTVSLCTGAATALSRTQSLRDVPVYHQSPLWAPVAAALLLVSVALLFAAAGGDALTVRGVNNTGGAGSSGGGGGSGGEAALSASSGVLLAGPVVGAVVAAVAALTVGVYLVDHWVKRGYRESVVSSAQERILEFNTQLGMHSPVGKH